MKRRSRAGGKPVKTRPGKTVSSKRRNAPKAAHGRRSSAVSEDTKVARLARELNEVREQHTATADVLKVISRSTIDLQTVLTTLVESASRHCDAYDAIIFLHHGGKLHVKAHYGPLHIDFAEWPIGREWITGRAFIERKTIHVSNPAAFAKEFPDGREMALRLGYRSILSVPLLRENEAIGVLTMRRSEARPFTKKQIELVETFAAQAVIAIENARLLNELRQRTDDLTESLDQQTATSEVLRVISSSPGELQPVFENILTNATRICGAQFGILHLTEGDGFRTVSLHNAPPEYVEAKQSDPIVRSFPRTSALSRVRETREVVQITDVCEAAAYRDGGDTSRALFVRLTGVRSLLAVPMLKEDALVGVIQIYRQEVRPFTDKQIELVKNFAAQAVIAIENARLLSELRQRTTDLTEALEQQTATSEVLRVISSSQGDLERVFDSLLKNATRLCRAKFGNLYLSTEDGFRYVAMHGVPSEYAEMAKRYPVGGAQYRHTPLSRMARTKKVVDVPDLTLDESYTGNDPRIVALVETAGARTLVIVPMLKDDELIGAIAIYRQEVRPFTDEQINLLQNFAAQAVIAIENARLLNELRQRTDDLTESLEQQTATSQVLQVISSSPGELEPVFQAMLENATRICEAKFGNLFRFNGMDYQLVAEVGAPLDLIEFLRRRASQQPIPGSLLDRVMRTKQVCHTADIAADAIPSPAARFGGARSGICVPMLKEDVLVGAIFIYRQEVRPFSDKQIELLTNFAAQAVIAIENTRLLNELRQRTDDLSKSLEDLRTAQDRLVQTEKLASLGQLTAGIAHEIKNPLNFVNNFSAVSVELIDELREALGSVHLDEKMRTEINDIANMLQGNLDKVVQHGKRADAIVKNMLLHSRQGSGENRPVDINALVEESLNLAYHGARAEKQGFTITMERSYDPAAGEVDLFPQEITRVLLNLISNGFYAATKRKAEANGGDYEPTLAASTKNLGDRVEIRIRDNGTGIPPEVREKMFNPFFTTKPAGEGTGLGLSISHDIIVKQHGGSIEVDTQPGEFTEFRIVLPRGAGTVAKSGERA